MPPTESTGDLAPSLLHDAGSMSANKAQFLKNVFNLGIVSVIFNCIFNSLSTFLKPTFPFSLALILVHQSWEEAGTSQAPISLPFAKWRRWWGADSGLSHQTSAPLVLTGHGSLGGGLEIPSVGN